MEERTLLSPAELIKRKLQDKTLPTRGPKDLPNANDTLSRLYEEQNQILSEERVEKLGSLVQGVLISHKNRVQLPKPQGKFWITMGYMESGVGMLLPEESLYLLEASHLEIYHEGLSLSIQEAYALLLNETECSEKQYITYSHLCRMGYVVIRHKPSAAAKEKLMKTASTHEFNSPKRSIDTIDISDSPECKKARVEDDIIVLDGDESADEKVTIYSLSKNRPETPEVPLPNFAGKTVLHLPIPPAHLLPANVNITEEMCTIDSAKLAQQENHRCYHRGNSPVNRWNHGDRYNNYNRQRNDYYVGGHHSRLPARNWRDHESNRSFSSPSSSMRERENNFNYPRWETDCRTSYNDRSRERDYRQRENFHDNRGNPQEDFDCGKGSQNNDDDSSLRTCKNWKEYKSDSVTRKTKDFVRSSPGAHLWEGHCIPILQPSEAGTTASVFANLQTVKPLNISNTDITTRFPAVKTVLKVTYDVYLPNTQFRKSCPPPPNHRIIVLSSSDEVLQLADLAIQAAQFNDGIPLHAAVVDNGQVNFYSFHDVSLPNNV